MLRIFLKVIAFFGRFLFSLRYRVTVRGKELLTKENLNKKAGILFLPNHPAHLDPIFVCLALWSKFQMRPLVIEYVFRYFGLRTIMKLVHALPIPNFESSVNEFKLKNAEKVLDQIIKGLKKKDNYLLYPAGRLKHTGKEVLGGASAAHSILQQCPDTNVVLVRTTGLWGSSFSRALTGTSPNLTENFFKGIKIILKNFIFFAPRRKVTIDILPLPKECPVDGTRVEFNRYLENWYNQYPDKKGNLLDTEPAQLISYCFWKKELPSLYKPKKKAKRSLDGKVSEEIQDKVIKELAKLSEHPEKDIQPEMNLALDLGIDSLDVAQIVGFLCDHFDIEEIHPEDLETVQDVLNFAERPVKSPKETQYVARFKWPKEPPRQAAEIPSGKTIPEAFLRSCDRMSKSLACADDVVGPLTYQKMKRAALVLALKIRKMPGKHIGILLPASCGAYIVILAVLLAGKVPVMLNWTLGKRYLNEMVEKTSIQVILSSWRFLEKLFYVEFGELTEKVVLLEDVKRGLSIFTKLRGALLAKYSTYPILRKLGINHFGEERTAVVLFTSGTEAGPKGVPLSHKNILSNQLSAFQCVDLNHRDIMLGILPPFHSFGFSVAGLMPILCGLKIAFSPDPTDSFALAEAIVRWKISIFCSAPSFLKGVLSAASAEQLQRIRYFVSGAEKTPQEVFDKVYSLGGEKQLLEGYGITECSPILTINRINQPPDGVGKLVPGVELCTIHPESGELFEYGKEGEICVRGPNVFKGYLGGKKSPFIELMGKVWYRTGDLGYLNERGSLILSGRLKRFVKVGGEMISLGAIEEVISEHFTKAKSEEGPCLAVCADEKDESRPNLVVFTTMSFEKQQVNDALKESGFSRIVKVSRVEHLDEIPLTGTGKTDYRTLQEMVAKL